MQLLVVLAALSGALFSVRAAAVLPVEERSPIHVSRVRRLISIRSHVASCFYDIFSFPGAHIELFVHLFVGMIILIRAFQEKIDLL